jgi:hypothetical protein
MTLKNLEKPPATDFQPQSWMNKGQVLQLSYTLGMIDSGFRFSARRAAV